MKPQRKHQIEMQRIVSGLAVTDLPKRILAHVVPGGGKSWLPAIAAKQFPQFKIAWFVPRLSLKEQGAQAVLSEFGLRLMETESVWNPTKNERGFITTHQAL